MIKLLLCLPLLATTSLVEPNKDLVIEGLQDSRDYTYTLAQSPLSISTRMDSEDFTIIYQPSYVVNSPALDWQYNLQSGHDFDITYEYTLTDWLGGVSLLSDDMVKRESVYDSSFGYTNLLQYAFRPGALMEDVSLDDNSHVGLINGYQFAAGVDEYLYTTISNITFQWDKFIWKTNESSWTQDYYLVLYDVNRSADYPIGIETSYIISHYDYTSNTWQYEPRNETLWFSSSQFNAISGDVLGFYIPIFKTINAFDYVEFDYQMITNCQITIRCAGDEGTSNVEMPYALIAPIQENSNYNEENQLLLEYLQYRDNFLPPAEELNVDFVGWIGLAIGSFINFEIVPGFSIGGIFSALIMIAFAIWIIKMFLGG